MSFPHLNLRRSPRSHPWLRVVVALLLLFNLSGAYWWVLQTVAWSGMIVSYTAKSGLVQGVEETFDGDHPCKMCDAIKQARESDSAHAASLASPQQSGKWIGLLPEAASLVMLTVFPHAVSSDPHLESHLRRPPIPPPRFLPA